MFDSPNLESFLVMSRNRVRHVQDRRRWRLSAFKASILQRTSRLYLLYRLERVPTILHRYIQPFLLHGTRVSQLKSDGNELINRESLTDMAFGRGLLDFIVYLNGNMIALADQSPRMCLLEFSTSQSTLFKVVDYVHSMVRKQGPILDILFECITETDVLSIAEDGTGYFSKLSPILWSLFIIASEPFFNWIEHWAFLRTSAVPGNLALDHLDPFGEFFISSKQDGKFDLRTIPAFLPSKLANAIFHQGKFARIFDNVTAENEEHMHSKSILLSAGDHTTKIDFAMNLKMDQWHDARLKEQYEILISDMNTRAEQVKNMQRVNICNVEISKFSNGSE